MEARRNKFDKFHVGTNFFKRYTTDITHFDICAIPKMVESKTINVIGVSKHMYLFNSGVEVNYFVITFSGIGFTNRNDDTLQRSGKI